MKSNEKILIEQLLDGSVNAFDTLYNMYSAKLYNFIMKISNYDLYLAEEIVQRVFIKIWETKHNLNPEKSFNAFICTIARNMLMNEYNHEMVGFVYENYMKQKITETSTVTEENIEFSFLKQYLETLIDKLPPACREVYKLSRLELYTNKEIAEHLQKSESTVEKQLAKANKFINETLKQHYDKIFILIGIANLF